MESLNESLQAANRAKKLTGGGSYDTSRPQKPKKPAKPKAKTPTIIKASKYGKVK